MRILFLLVKIALFLLLLGFALKNTDPVTIRYFLGMEWQAPLAFVLLVTFGLGIFGGMLTNLLVAAKLRRELLALKRELHAHRHVRAPVPVEAA
jgi:putative membrane protein